MDPSPVDPSQGEWTTAAARLYRNLSAMGLEI